MLKEIVPTRQIPNEPRRVWFTDDVMDLIVWYADDGSILGFQLCDDKGSNEHALTWFRGKGYSYERVDDGEGRPGRYKMSPVLLPDGIPDIDKLLRHFRHKSERVPADIRVFVVTKLQEHKAVKFP
jgi:hypothetical protein